MFAIISLEGSLWFASPLAEGERIKVRGSAFAESDFV
jgi:hypothetical protein